MRFILVTVTFLLGLMALTGVAAAQSAEVSVGKIDFPQRVWGTQRLTFDVTNHTEYLKFIMVEADVTFEESYSGARRVKTSNFPLGPDMSMTINPEVEIPGNYGQATCWVRLYDAVDTLDDVSLATKLFEQKFLLKFRDQVSVQPYRQEKVTVPPLVGGSYAWDSELSLLTVTLLNEGKTEDEIAEILNVKKEIVSREVQRKVADGHIRKDVAAGYRLNVPVITLAEAQEGRKYADELSDQMVALIKKNLETYPALIDSLKTSGAFSGDSANFYEGGALLYQRYPLIAGMLLWYDLGHRFITEGGRMMIYRPNAMCAPKLGEFMYLAQGGDYYNGSHYFNPTVNIRYHKVDFGDVVPRIECTPKARSTTGRVVKGQDWSIDPEFSPQAIVFDTALSSPAIRHLRTGFPEMLLGAIDRLAEIDQKFGHAKLSRGVKFWFWNLTATRTVTKLVEEGVLTRSGNGQFSLQSHDLNRKKAAKK
ncbi:MAG: helix-turn-helix domain-containing protein [bacterium]|nr:helix-turn-helix domain-containing protein [bacterium]